MTTEDPLALVGTTIAEKYAIESVVGQGGFATVYRATHAVWKRPVAVKVFTALGEVDAEQRQRLLDDFIQEGALLAELSERTTAICQARDIGMLVTAKGDSVPYMVLEWLDGRALEDVLLDEREEGVAPRNLEEALALLEPVGEALALAHKKGIAHRDVKPANVFVLGADARAPVGVKLLDFGIAKVVQDVQKMGFGKTAGHITSFTPLYGAPEQFNRAYGSTGPWTDVFALALVIVEVLSGRMPLDGQTIVELAYAAADPKRRPTPRTLGVGVSDEVEAVFQKAVAVKTEDRYATAEQFWAALRMAVDGSAFILTSTNPRVAPIALGSTEADPRLGAGATLLDPPRISSVTAMDPARSPGTRRGALLVASGIAAAVLATIVTVSWLVAGRGGSSKAQTPPVPSSAPASSSSSIASRACPEGMVSVPGGEYFMGSDEKDAEPSEKPPHRVKLAPYCLDELEVTVAQFKECSDGGGCRRAGKENVWPGIRPVQRKIYDPLCNANDPVAMAKHPINCVDWEQAREYCEWRGGRLPTEAEWEFAARGPDGRIYPWGDEPPSASLLNACGRECVAWQKDHRDPDGDPAMMYDEDDHFPNTAPVGSFPKGKSRYGIQDVVGNVWEWVADRYAAYPTSGGVVIDPVGPATGDDRVIRGGGWNGSRPSWVRPTYRFHVAPTARSHGFGFRCAKSGV